MKKRILKSDIRKMELTEEELFWSDELQDPEKTELYFKFQYTGSIECIPSMYRKSTIYFIKKYIKEHGSFQQCSLKDISIYIASIYCTSTERIIAHMKGVAYNDNRFYIADAFGLDVFDFYPKGING